MALSISVSATSSTSVTVYLYGLDTSWTNGTRKVDWYLGYANGGIPTETAYYRKKSTTLADAIAEGGEVTFAGLSPSTSYGVCCKIYHGSTLLAEKSGYATTDAEETTHWGVYGESQIDVGDWGTSISDELSEYTVVRYPLVFLSVGIIGISLWCDADTIIYLSKDYDVDYATGMPISYEAISYNGYIRYNQVYDDETYYLFIRGKTGTEIGSFNIDITPPWCRAYGDLGLISESGITKEERLFKLHLFRLSCGFAKSGPITISVTSDMPVMCLVGTSTNEDVDRPLIFDAYGESVNISIPYSVEQGVTYYIWLRPYYNTDSVRATLQISYDSETSIAKWDWNASTDNNNAYLSLVNKTATTNFSHLVWMDMVDKVWEIIQATTNWWDEDYASLYDTKNLPQNSDGLYNLTAVAFNSLRNNIELIGNQSSVLGYKTGIGQVLAHDPNYPVKAEYFLTLANYINSCIDNL